MECPDVESGRFAEIVEETQQCDRCIKEASDEGRRRGSDWDAFLAWRRRRSGEYDS
jgi:hypothetical protein